MTIYIHPDDQLLDYFLYKKKIKRAQESVNKFMTGYEFWLSKTGRPR